MKSLVVYHGSPNIIHNPEFGAGNPHNDYGTGFYCTKEVELAKEWACPSPNSGFANRYKINTENLDVLNLCEEYGILSWLSILLENRIFDTNTSVMKEAKDFLLEKFLPDYKNKDIIVGYRADDSYFSFAKAFLNNSISLDSLAKAMKLGLLGEQICIKSKRAFQNLQFIDYEIADGSIYYNKRSYRDIKAREDYITILNSTKSRDSIFMIDIIRQDWRIEHDIIR